MDIAAGGAVRRAAAMLPATSRWRAAAIADVALPPEPLTLPLPPHRRQAATDVALSRCRHRRSLRTAATALPPSRCAPPLRFALPPPPIGVLGGGIILFYLRCVFLDMCVFWADFRYLFGFC